MTDAAARVAAAVPFRTTTQRAADLAARFAADTAGHELTVVRDDGHYRHLRFRRPGSSMYWFDLLTWPGSLTVTGDMGTFVFAREADMFTFFRGERVNPGYWVSKLLTPDRGDFSEDLFAEHVADVATEWVEDLLAGGEGGRADALLAEVRAEVLSATGEEDARAALEAFDDGAGHTFTDSWEWTLREPSTAVLWCCHAIRWGIARYDTARYDSARAGQPTAPAAVAGLPVAS